MWADNASKIDMLSYEPYAELLHDIALSERVNPLTIGLFGSWGSGKSTVLNLVEGKIKRDSNKEIVSVFVNAWMFEGYDDAKTALMEVILRTLEENEDIKQRVGEKLRSLRDRIDWFRVGSYAVKKGGPALLSATLGNPLPIMIDSLKTLIPKDSKEAEEAISGIKKTKEFLKEEPNDNVVQNIRMFREEFEQMMSDSKIGNLIIIIDDLDRCSPERIIDTLEAIKLFLAVKKTTFILAIDEDVISYAVHRKYPKIDDETLNISKDYIEKIVQMPIRIPELSDIDVKNYLLLLVCEMFLSERQLERLLNGLKERQVFVKGEIISQNEILQIIDFKANNSIEVLKNGFEKKDFIDQLNVFAGVAEVISSTLKGNPRQAKRFLNSFYIRKRLSEIQRLNLDLRILAKLMVLEYTHLELFRELYTWQVRNEGYAKELEEIEKISEEDKVDETKAIENKKQYNAAWLKPIVQQWLSVEPVKLSDKDLRQYFYLAKESIKEKGISILNLTSEERKWVNDICTIKLQESLRKLKIEEFVKNQSLDHSKIIKGIISKYHTNREEYIKVLILIYEQMPNHREELIKEIKKLQKNEFNPAIILNFNSIKMKDIQHYQDIKQYFIAEGIVDEDMWKSIENPRK